MHIHMLRRILGEEMCSKRVRCVGSRGINDDNYVRSRTVLALVWKEMMPRVMPDAKGSPEASDDE